MVELMGPIYQGIEYWRGAYAQTAQAASWLSAHQWNYGPDIAARTARDVRQKLQLQPGDRLLEVGAGSGAFMEAVLFPGQKGIGFDFCADQVRSMVKFGVNTECIKLGVAEACRIPVSSNSYDKVLCYSVVHYFPDDQYLRATIAEMLRIIRPRGIALLGDVAGVMERTRKLIMKTGVPAERRTRRC